MGFVEGGDIRTAVALPEVDGEEEGIEND